MAVFFNGMSRDEAVALTLAMRDSGDVLDWSDLPGPVTDKHSTGGVGDNVSLMLAPIVAACGAYVPMISGRGLGHTGGTLDKMDSIPGYVSQPDNALFRKAVLAAGCAIIGQTADLAPADKRFYAIRDVTATVESVPLITASILSKKLAAGLQSLVLDVKIGNGAFMAKSRDATELATSLVEVANGAGLKTTALITGMNEPLASAAGNAVEVANAVDFLTGRAPRPRLARGHAGACRRDAASRRHRRLQPGGRCRAPTTRWKAAGPPRLSAAWSRRSAARPISSSEPLTYLPKAPGRACRRGRASGFVDRHRHPRHRPCRRGAGRRPHAARGRDRPCRRPHRPAAGRRGSRSRASRWPSSMRARKRRRRGRAGDPRSLFDRRRQAGGAESGRQAHQRPTAKAIPGKWNRFPSENCGRQCYCISSSAPFSTSNFAEPLQEAHADQRAVERLVVEHHRLDVLDVDAADLQAVDR